MASENQIKHRIVISGEQEYKRTMREMSAQLKEAKSEVKATAAEMDNQGKSVDTLTAQMKALESQRQKEADMLREMQRHLEAVVSATGAESDEAVKLRTRINAMRAEVAQTSSQLSRMTGELDEAKEAAEGLGGSGAADGIRSLGTAAEAAEGDLNGILGKLDALGQGFTIGIGATIGQSVLSGVSSLISDAVVTGWNEAVNSRIEYNQIGIKTGTAGGATNDYMSGMLDRLKIQNPNRATNEWIDALAAAYTQFPEQSFNNADRLNEILKKLDAVSYGVGIDLPGTINIVGRLKDVFGENESELGDVLYWLGTSKAGDEGISTLESYATTWKNIGMNAIGAAGALVLARISGVSNLDAVGKAAKEAEEFIKTDKAGLNELGVMADDLPGKFQAGTEEAKEAMKLLMNTFLGADQETQNELGGRIFGQENWERYGTRIAKAIVGGYETTLTDDMRDATKRATDAVTNDFKSQSARLWELVTQSLGDVFSGAEESLTPALKQGVDAANAAREGGAWGLTWVGSFFDGFWGGMEEGAQRFIPKTFENMFGEGYTTDDITDAVLREFGHNPESYKKAEEAGQENVNAILEAYYAGAAKRNSALPPDMPAGQATEVDAFLDKLLGVSGSDDLATAAEKAGEEDSGTVLAAYAQGLSNGQDFESVKAQVEDLNAQIASALGAGDSDLVADLTAKRDALIPVMMQLAANVKTTGEDSASGFDTAFKGVEVTVEDTMTGAVEKLQSGAEQFAPTGKQGIDSLIAELEAGQDPAFSAGWNLADQFDRGFRERMDMHSPSRVMAEAGRFTIEGLMQGLDNGAGDLERMAASVSEILSSGARSAGSGIVHGNAGNAGYITKEDLDDSLTGFAGKVALMIDGEIAGGLLERSVSSATARRAAGTIRGRSAAQRSW